MQNGEKSIVIKSPFRMICGKCSCDKLSIIWIQVFLVKFIYSEKSTHFCEISTVDLSYVVMVKSTVEISKQFVTFSEYMSFIGSMYSFMLF